MAERLAGLREGEQDYPITVRESVTPLPFFLGGTTTLTAGEISDLVKVSDLRRFENSDSVARGTHTGSDGDSVLTDSDADFINWGIEVGDELVNETASTTGTIIDLTSTTVTTENQTWASNANYTINKRAHYLGARAIEIRKFSVSTDIPIYLRLDGAPDATDGFTVELERDDTYFEVNVRVASRIAVVGVSSTTTPKVRWTAWGI